MYGVNYKTTACLRQKFVVVTCEEKQKEKKNPKWRHNKSVRPSPLWLLKHIKEFFILYWCKTEVGRLQLNRNPPLISCQVNLSGLWLSSGEWGSEANFNDWPKAEEQCLISCLWDSYKPLWHLASGIYLVQARHLRCDFLERKPIKRWMVFLTAITW